MEEIMQDQNMNNMSATKDLDKQYNGGGKQTPASEWIVASTGLLLVVSTIAFILYRGIADSEAPPDVVIGVEGVQRVSSGYMVRFKAHNGGSETLADLVIDATLQQGSNAVETSSITLDYLPAHSSRKGGFFFRKNPGEYQLTFRSGGFQQP